MPGSRGASHVFFVPTSTPRVLPLSYHPTMSHSEDADVLRPPTPEVDAKVSELASRLQSSATRDTTIGSGKDIDDGFSDDEDEDKLFEELEKDEFDMSGLREKRMEELKAQIAQVRDMRENEHGRLTEITDEKEVIKTSAFCGKCPMARGEVASKSATLRNLLCSGSFKRQDSWVEELGNEDGFKTAKLELRLTQSGWYTNVVSLVRLFTLLWMSAGVIDKPDEPRQKLVTPFGTTERILFDMVGARYLIVGANRGIGLEFVKQLLGKSESKVIGTYRNAQTIDELKKLSEAPSNKDRLNLVRLDMNDEQSCKDAANEVRANLGEIDILVVNAGANGGKPLLTEDIANISRLFDNNVLGPIRVCQAFVPLLQNRSTANGVLPKIALISSESGSITVSKHGRGPAYAISKAGLNMMGHRHGGSGAIVTPEDSVRGMLQVIDKLDIGNSGGFWDYEGKEHPWRFLVPPSNSRLSMETTLNRLPHITRRDFLVSLLTALVLALFLTTTRQTQPAPTVAVTRPLESLRHPPPLLKMPNNQERSYIMIKPDGVQRALVGEILSRFEKRGFKIVALKLVHATKEHLEEHYGDLKDKPFFPGLIKYMASGPVVAIVIEGLDAVKTGRAMLGATNPLASGPGTIRGDYALAVGRNICHGSDSIESAEKEIKHWFPEGIVQYTDDKATWIFDATNEVRRFDWRRSTSTSREAGGKPIANVPVFSTWRGRSARSRIPGEIPRGIDKPHAEVSSLFLVLTESGHDVNSTLCHNVSGIKMRLPSIWPRVGLFAIATARYAAAATGGSYCGTLVCVTGTISGSDTIYTLNTTASFANVGWMAVGFGESMVGSPMVIMWANEDGTLVLSQREATVAHAQPQVVSTPPRVAAIRSDLSTLTGSAVSFSFSVPSSGQSSERMIYAFGRTKPNSNSVSATLAQHSVTGSFTLNLAGTVPDSPLISASPSGTGSVTTTTLAVPTQSGGSGSDTLTIPYSAAERKLLAHGILSALGFCFFSPNRRTPGTLPQDLVADLVQDTLDCPGREAGMRHFNDKHTIIGLVLFLLYVCQALYGLIIHIVKDPYRRRRPAQNYGHAILGLAIIALSLYQVWLGFNHEWPSTTGRDRPAQGLRTFWIIWVVVLGAAYIIGLALLPKQYKAERYAVQDGGKNVGYSASDVNVHPMSTRGA
ncbi:Homocysteine S-methyltransferase [Rhizoctonia solani]|uniref:Nucleoside diphosphate kinase n=1 Tax=Rhizoctonia solani TaxID=456999 RepID=A0A8H7M9V3_9AGAM|nr:Homocysteine S-methyltransferase [Rhizoctonia solani]